MHPLILTVLKQHVDCVKRCPANGEEQNNGDHHFNCSFLFPVEGKTKMTYVDLLQQEVKRYRCDTNDGTVVLKKSARTLGVTHLNGLQLFFPCYTQFAKANSLYCSPNSHCSPGDLKDMLC